MNRQSSLRPWLIWTLSALFVVFNYIQQVVPNIIAVDLSQAFKATESTLGNIAASYFYAYAILQIPVGLVVDRYGTRRPLVIAILAAGLGTLAFLPGARFGDCTACPLGHGRKLSLLIYRLLEAGAGMVSSRPIFHPGRDDQYRRNGWSRQRRTGGRFGKCDRLACGGGLDGRSRTDSGGSGFCGGSRSNGGRQPSCTETQSGGMFGLLANRQVWINAVYATSISLVFVAFGGLWGECYIRKVYDLSAVAAAGIGSLLFLGGIAGSLFFGWYSDYLGRRKTPMVLAGVGALATMAGLLYLPGIPLTGFKLGLFLVGFFSSANIISYAVARDLYPKLAGFSIGFLSTCYFAGSAASQPLVGMLLEHGNPGSQRVAGLASLTAGDYRHALSPLVGFMLVGLIASLLVKETMSGTARR